MTVVVAPRDRDAKWLGSCLASLAKQAYTRLEILVVIPPGAARVADVAREHAREDGRIRIEHKAGSPGARRNFGALLVGGEFLCFADAGDIFPPAGLRLLVNAVAGSGSDFAVGRQLESPREPTRQPASDPVHDMRRSATTIEEFPLAVIDTGVGNRLYRTSFWREAKLAFPDQEGTDLVSFDAFVRARTFDVLPEATCRRKLPVQGVPLGTVPAAREGLDRWISEQRRILDRLEGVDAAAVRDAWAYVICDSGVTPYIDDVEAANAEQWEALRDFMRMVTGPMSPQSWRRIRSESRVKTWLIVEDRRRQLEEFLTRRWLELGNCPTEVTGGQVRAKLPFYQEPAAGVPDSIYEMTEEETSLQVVLRRIRWSDSGMLQLHLLAYVDFLDQSDEVPFVEAHVVDARTRRRFPVQVTPYVDVEATAYVGHRYQDYANGGCVVLVDVGALLDEPAPHAEGEPAGTGVGKSPREWWLDFHVALRGVERRGPITRRDERGTAGQLGSALVSGRTLAGHRIRIRPHPERGIGIVALPPLEVGLAEVDAHGRQLSGRLVAGTEMRWLVANHPDGGEARCPLAGGSDGYRFSLDLPTPRGRASKPWRLRALDEHLNEHLVGFPGNGARSWLEAQADAELTLLRDDKGACELAEAGRTLVLEDLLLEDGHVRILGRWPGVVPPRWNAGLRGKRVQSDAKEIAVDGQQLEAAIPMRCNEWGLGETCLPTGPYTLEVHTGPSEHSEPVQIILSQRVADKLLTSTVVGDLRITPVHPGQLTLRLAAPLLDDERGAYFRRRLQEWHGQIRTPVDRSAVYFQSYTGMTATDSQRALHDELRRVRPDLTIYWGVADRSVMVPEGGIGVLIRSRDWFRVLATARVLCHNADFGPWFHKRTEQWFLETFHGYPAKSMGIRLWESKRFSARRIELELERTSSDWDLILTPAPEMDKHYRTEYRYDGPIESAGYPRDDVLVSPGASTVRRRTRELLGIDAAQTVVLYAPTWRDDLATGRGTPLVRHLDLETATQKLGPDYVFLMRGHRFNARTQRRPSRTARLIDVTDYPEVNDLILAADAAVLDYSSLRFDFALTGRPMLFLVPDLHQYTESTRGFLFPFEESAPGPLIEDAEEVVERLRDLDAVRQEYADEYAAFNARFNYLQDGHAAQRVVKRMLAETGL